MYTQWGCGAPDGLRLIHPFRSLIGSEGHPVRPVDPCNVSLLVHLHGAVPELGGVVSAVLVGGLHPEHLGVVLPDEAGGEQVVDPGATVMFVPVVVYVAGEQGLDAVLL